MTVNVKKSEVVVFNKQYCPARGDVHIQYNGVDMVIKPSFVYLGIVFDEGNGVKEAVRRSISKGRAAMFALVRRCYELNIHNVYTRCRLFDSLVVPILNYGCEVWGPSNLVRGSKLLSGVREEVEKMHISFLRQCLGVRRSTSAAIIMHELGRVCRGLLWYVAYRGLSYPGLVQ
jgi:hypothetical protein